MKRKKERITFGCTVLNEEKDIGKFLNSILKQSILPDEIIIVDGGSTDKTVEIIKRYQKKSKVPIRLIVEKGANIARGRNIYMKKVKSGLLFSGDSGTRFEKDWIKKLLKGFDKGADVVFGAYVPEKPKNILEKVVNTRIKQYSYYSDEDWKKEEPSNRQAAYRISSWRKIGKFPEWMDRADDAWIYDRAKKAGLKFYPIKNAKVFWHARRTLKQYLKLAYKDSVSEGISGIVWKRKICLAEFILILSFLASIVISFINLNSLFWILGVLFLIFLIYFIKIVKKTKSINTSLYGGLISVLLFLVHSMGDLIGLLIGILSKNKISRYRR